MPASTGGIEQNDKPIPQITAASIAQNDPNKTGNLIENKGAMLSVATIVVGSIFTASNGSKALPTKYEKNATIEFDNNTDDNKIPSTTGAFFLNDRMPEVMNANTMKGNKKPKHSLKTRLIL